MACENDVGLGVVMRTTTTGASAPESPRARRSPSRRSPVRSYSAVLPSDWYSFVISEVLSRRKRTGLKLRLRFADAAYDAKLGGRQFPAIHVFPCTIVYQTFKTSLGLVEKNYRLIGPISGRIVQGHLSWKPANPNGRYKWDLAIIDEWRRGVDR